MFANLTCCGSSRRETGKVPVLGVLKVDVDCKPVAGDLCYPGSFAYKVCYRTLKGLTPEMSESGNISNEAKQELVEAIRYLESQGVTGITGNCGFLLRLQNFAREYTSKPVFLSSLLQLSAITCAYDREEKVAIFTGSKTTLANMRDAIRKECSVDYASSRYVIVECNTVPGFEKIRQGEKVNEKEIEEGIVKKAMQAAREQPLLVAILMEGAEMPPYSDAVRAATGLPVFDAITCANFFVKGFTSAEGFGLTCISDSLSSRDGKLG